jgi:hypothetical protein
VDDHWVIAEQVRPHSQAEEQDLPLLELRRAHEGHSSQGWAWAPLIHELLRNPLRVLERLMVAHDVA